MSNRYEYLKGFDREQLREVQRASFAGRAVDDVALAPAAVQWATRFPLGQRGFWWWTYTAVSAVLVANFLWKLIGGNLRAILPIAFFAIGWLMVAFLRRRARQAVQANLELINSTGR